MSQVRFKICCIVSKEEAELAINQGASAIGLVSKMPSGPGVISENRIAEIAAWAPPGVSTFLLTCLQDGKEVVEQVRRCRTNTVQLCDALDVSQYGIIRQAMPALKIVQVIHVVDEESYIDAITAAEHVDALLLDSGNPRLEVKLLGGTGRIHNWEISKRIVERVPVPVFLAGGLNPENAADAVKFVRPYALDVCSGVRTNGELDEKKLKDFAKACTNG